MDGINKGDFKISQSAIKSYKNNNFDGLYVRITKIGEQAIYKIDTTNFTSLQKVKHFIFSLLTSTTYLHGKKAEEFIKTTDKITQNITKIFIKEKFQRAVQKAKIIGKGLMEMERQGIKGTILKDDYWDEAINPTHEGGHLKKIKEALWVAHSTTPHLSLEEWEQTSEGQQTLKKYLGDDYIAYETRTEYLDTKSREKLKLSFVKEPDSNNCKLKRQGKLYDTSHEKTDSGEGFVIFAISPQGDIYSNPQEVRKFHHSSFLSGGATMGTGEIRVNSEGHITDITNGSGHYRPNKEETLVMLQLFENKGVDLSNVRLILFGPQGGICNAKEFLDNKGNLPLEPHQSRF